MRHQAHRQFTVWDAGMDVTELLTGLGIEVPTPTSEGEVSIHCFCGRHSGEGGSEEHNSCSLNVYSGLWFCHTTGTKGNVVKAVECITKKSHDEAVAYVRFMDVRTWDPKGRSQAAGSGPSSLPEKVIDEGIADVYHRNLFSDKAARSRAIREFGWSDETMKRFKIGYDLRTRRYSFPIRNEDGKIVNFRLYNPDSKGKDKVISWTDGQGKTGYGHGRIWPVQLLREAHTVIDVEGEKDCTLMNQVLEDNGMTPGWCACTGTGGAGTWKREWSAEYEGKHVIKCYDRDKAGQEAAQRSATEQMPFAESIKIATLDIEDEKGDVTDYYVKHSRTWDQMLALFESTEPFTGQQKKVLPIGVRDTNLYKPHLSEASEEQYLFKSLEMKVMVAGKDLAPYAVPAKIHFGCAMNQGQLCQACSSLPAGGVQSFDLDREDPDIIKLVKQSEDQQMTFLRRRRGINGRCKAVDCVVEKYHNVEELTIIPEIDFSAEVDREYVSRTAYAMEHGILPNKSYIAMGTAVPHPKTAHVVHFFHEINNAQDNVDDFDMDPRKMERLRSFQPTSGQSVRDKFDEIALDLSHNITRIYGRDDLIIAADLCYHTVIGFDFQGKPVAKAWGDIGIVGDTRTGKTETVQSLIQHYKLGELAMGENTSYAGLIGGLRQESGGRWILNWGRLPLNDRRLLGIDETSGLSQEIIGLMSGIRSNGVAEIMKITGMQRTLARTRLIWISNPRSNRGLADYSHGVEVLRELIGRPEDIARFDFVVTAASNEVPTDVINAAQHQHVDHVYTSELCHMLLLWTWSRKREHVVFTEGTTQKILELATDQSDRYSSEGGIPLVEAGNHRIKLAKLAVSAAARTFSTDDGEHLLVRPEHAEFAADFLDDSYDKPSLDYTGFSQALLARTHVSDSYKDQTRSWIKNNVEIADLFRIHPSLRIDDFKNIFDLETKDVKSDIIKPLSKLRMIEKTRQSEFRKTPVFITLLKEARTEGLFSQNGNGPGGSGQVDPAYDPETDDIPF